MAGPFELQIRQFGEKAGDKADVVVRKLLLDVWGELILRSPVLSGRFRANWLYGAGVKPSGIVLTSGTKESPTPAPDAPDFSAAGMGQAFYFTNNLPYALPLERGSSAQAPQGIAGLTVLRFNEFIANAVTEAR